jgi:hypothetical protein
MQAYFSDGVAASSDSDVITAAVRAAGNNAGPALAPAASNGRRGNRNAYRQFRAQFNNFDLKSARLNAHTRRRARQLVEAKKADSQSAVAVRRAEDELKLYAKHVRRAVLLFRFSFCFL